MTALVICAGVAPWILAGVGIRHWLRCVREQPGDTVAESLEYAKSRYVHGEIDLDEYERVCEYAIRTYGVDV